MLKNPAASVSALWRYPVKSMLGESLQAAVVTASGLSGDRLYALVDPLTDQVASAKNIRKWPLLFACRAALEAGTDAVIARDARVAIGLPDGRRVYSDEGDIDAVLEQAFGRPARLTSVSARSWSYDTADRRSHRLALGAPEGTFFDLAPLHLLTTASLAQLRALRPEADFDARRFRPNLVIDTGTQQGFVENQWVGQELAIGDELRVCVTLVTPRCVMTTLAQDGLPADPRVLRDVGRLNRIAPASLGQRQPCAGVYASVLRAGCVRRGDTVRVIGASPLQRAGLLARAAWRALPIR